MKRIVTFAAPLLLCLLLFLFGCGVSGGSDPVQASAEQGDFRATLTSARSVYDSDSLDPEAPLDFEVRVDYLGQEGEVPIFYGADLGYIALYNEEGIDILEDYGLCFPLYAQYGTLGPDKPFVQSFTGDQAYALLGELSAGSYVAKTRVSFSVVEGGLLEADLRNPKEKVELDLELSFEIR